MPGLEERADEAAIEIPFELGEAFPVAFGAKLHVDGSVNDVCVSVPVGTIETCG